MEDPQFLTYITGGVSLINLGVVLRFIFATGKFVGRIETTVKNLSDLPARVNELEKDMAVLPFLQDRDDFNHHD